MSAKPETVAPVVLAKRPFLRGMVLVAAALVAASVTVQILSHEYGYENQLGFRALFDMSGEGNLPAWFSGVTLLLLAGLFAWLRQAAAVRGDSHTAGWTLLALVCLAASVDEVAGIHEGVVGLNLRILLEDQQAKFFYLVPGVVLLVAIGWALSGFFAALDPAIRRPLAVGIAVWLTGAVLLEAIEGVDAVVGTEPFRTALFNTAQDTLEIAGAMLTARALIDYARDQHVSLTLRVA